jgi:hypothetical protein
MFKHWQQMEQEAKDNIARYHYERTEAKRSQQMMSRYFKTVVRVVRHVISDRKEALGLVTVFVCR